jgi:hypothetical protein
MKHLSKGLPDGQELIVSRRILGTIVCLLTARIACFCLFFFNVPLSLPPPPPVSRKAFKGPKPVKRKRVIMCPAVGIRRSCSALSCICLAACRCHCMAVADEKLYIDIVRWSPAWTVQQQTQPAPLPFLISDISKHLVLVCWHWQFTGKKLLQMCH